MKERGGERQRGGRERNRKVERERRLREGREWEERERDRWEENGIEREGERERNRETESERFSSFHSVFHKFVKHSNNGNIIFPYLCICKAFSEGREEGLSFCLFTFSHLKW